MTGPPSQIKALIREQEDVQPAGLPAAASSAHVLSTPASSAAGPQGPVLPVLPRQAPAGESTRMLTVTTLKHGRIHQLSRAEAHKYDLVYNRDARKCELVDADLNPKAPGFSMDNIVQAYEERFEVILESAFPDDSIHIHFRMMKARESFMEDFRAQTGRRVDQLKK